MRSDNRQQFFWDNFAVLLCCPSLSRDDDAREAGRRTIGERKTMPDLREATFHRSDVLKRSLAHSEILFHATKAHLHHQRSLMMEWHVFFGRPVFFHRLNAVSGLRMPCSRLNRYQNSFIRKRFKYVLDNEALIVGVVKRVVDHRDVELSRYRADFVVTDHELGTAVPLPCEVDHVAADIKTQNLIARLCEQFTGPATANAYVKQFSGGRWQ